MSKKLKKIDIFSRYVDSIDILYFLTTNALIFQLVKETCVRILIAQQPVSQLPIGGYAGFGKSTQLVYQIPESLMAVFLHQNKSSDYSGVMGFSLKIKALVNHKEPEYTANVIP